MIICYPWFISWGSWLYLWSKCDTEYGWSKSNKKDEDKLTVGPVLEGVLTLEELAGGVVSLTDPAGIQRGLGAQDLVTAYCLHTHTHRHTRAINVDRAGIKRMSGGTLIPLLSTLGVPHSNRTWHLDGKEYVWHQHEFFLQLNRFSGKSLIKPIIQISYFGVKLKVITPDVSTIVLVFASST